MEKTIILKKSKVPAEVLRALDAILADLEKYGRTTSTNGRAARYLGYRFRHQKRNGHFFQKYMPESKQSIIALHKYAKIEKVSDNKIKFIYEEEYGKKKDKNKY